MTSPSAIMASSDGSAEPFNPACGIEIMTSIGVCCRRFPRMRSWIMFMHTSARCRLRSVAVGSFAAGGVAIGAGSAGVRSAVDRSAVGGSVGFGSDDYTSDGKYFAGVCAAVAVSMAALSVAQTIAASSLDDTISNFTMPLSRLRRVTVGCDATCAQRLLRSLRQTSL